MYLVVAPAAIIAATVAAIATTTAATTIATTAITTTASATVTATTTAAVGATETAIIAAAFAITTTTTTVGAATAAAAITTATATATAISAAAIATTAFTRSARLSRSCLVNHDGATTQILTMHASNSRLSLRIIGHFHKAEAFGATRIALHHHACAGHAAKRAEGGLQIIVTNGIWQIANVQSITHLFYLSTSALIKRWTPKNTKKSDGVLSTAESIELYLFPIT
jgi:hypothetical protein